MSSEGYHAGQGIVQVLSVLEICNLKLDSYPPRSTLGPKNVSAWHLQASLYHTGGTCIPDPAT